MLLRQNRAQTLLHDPHVAHYENAKRHDMLSVCIVSPGLDAQGGLYDS